MPEDKVIKSGQFTLPRLLFLVVSGLLVFIIVATGRLNIGYILLTLAICVLLYLIATDWGVQMESIGTDTLAAARPDLNRSPAALVGAAPSEPVVTRQAAQEQRTRKRSSRQPKRRR